jgi:hypothetical protein
MMQTLLKYKNQILFGVSIFLFLFSISFFLTMHFLMGKDDGVPEEPIEVSLPVINWQKYYDLSKKYPNDIFNGVR